MPTLTSMGNRITRPVAIFSMCAAVVVMTPALTVTASAAPGHTAASGLPSASYAAIEKTLVASLPLDSGYEEAAWRKAFRVSCRHLNARVPLLDAYRPVCLDSATVYDLEAAVEACGESLPARNGATQVLRRCEWRAEDKMVDTDVQLIAAFRNLNKILVRDHLSQPCQASIGGTSAVIGYYTQIVPVLRLMAKGFLTDAPQKTAAAYHREQQLWKKYRLATNREQLSQFRRGCA